MSVSIFSVSFLRCEKAKSEMRGSPAFIKNHPKPCYLMKWTLFGGEVSREGAVSRQYNI